MEFFDSLLNLLLDGQKHSVNEISTLEGLRGRSITQITIILDFLKEYDFIDTSEDENFTLQAQITQPFQEFCLEVKKAE